MSFTDKAKNKAEELTGKAKQGIGDATDNERLQAEGQAQETSANAKQAGVRWITPGGILAVLLWIAASVGFGIYAANFGSYDKTYGTLAGVVIFLVWLWISNIAVLLGAELNATVQAWWPAPLRRHQRRRQERRAAKLERARRLDLL